MFPICQTQPETGEGGSFGVVCKSQPPGTQSRVKEGKPLRRKKQDQGHSGIKELPFSVLCKGTFLLKKAASHSLATCIKGQVIHN